MGANGRDRQQLRADAAQAMAEPPPAAGPPISMLPQTAAINLGFEQEDGQNVAVIANILIPGGSLMVGFDADYAKAIGAALIEHAAQLAPRRERIEVASPAEVEHIAKHRPGGAR